MSEAKVESEVKAEEKKKGGKLPLIIIVVVVLAGGGFFGMKMKNGGKAKKPEVKLSKAKPVDLKEFLVNLKDHSVYCRAEISLGLADGVDSKGLEDQTPVIRDAVNTVLQSESLAEVSTIDGIGTLKRKLAAAINKSLDEVDGKTDPASSQDSPNTTGGSTGSTQISKLKKASGVFKHPDWDSDTGPVLKIYFDSFATQ